MINTVNVDLLLVDNRLCVPIESLNKLLNLEPVEKSVPITTYSSTELVNKEPNLVPKVELDFSLIKPKASNYIPPDLSKSGSSKAKLLNNSQNIVIANQMLNSLLEDSKTLNWYKTSTYWGIARKFDNTLICSYTPEPKRSNFLSVYVPMRVVAGHLLSQRRPTNRKYKLILDSIEYPIARITTTNICVIHLQSSKSFYTLVKTLVNMFGEEV